MKYLITSIIMFVLVLTLPIIAIVVDRHFNLTAMEQGYTIVSFVLAEGMVAGTCGWAFSKWIKS